MYYEGSCQVFRLAGQFVLLPAHVTSRNFHCLTISSPRVKKAVQKVPRTIPTRKLSAKISRIKVAICRCLKLSAISHNAGTNIYIYILYINIYKRVFVSLEFNANNTSNLFHRLGQCQCLHQTSLNSDQVSHASLISFLL